MALARVVYKQSAAGNKNFTVPFPYLSRDHVKVTVNGAPAYFTWINTNTVQIDPAPRVGDVVEIRRVTERKRLLVDFKDGSTITETDLDLLALQNFYLSQEADDLAEESNEIARDAAITANCAGETANKALSTAASAVATANSAKDIANTALALATVDLPNLPNLTNLTRVINIEDVVGLQSALNGKLDYFDLPRGGDTLSWYKIAELPTNIDAGTNGLVLFVSGIGDYSDNRPGMDIVQVSTRGTVSVDVYEVVPTAAVDITYGYVNNANTGKTELWVRRGAYTYKTSVAVGMAEGATYGNLCNSEVEPAGITYVSKKTLYHSGNISTATSKLEFIQPGTGAVTRTVQDKLREWVNVKDFGAVGDGVTDDTAAIQAAVMASVGKVLYINNHHRVSAAGITVPSNSHIIFGPEGKLSLLPHNATHYEILRLHDVSDITIENAYIDGRRDLNSATTGEWGMGISIRGTTGRIVLLNPRTINCWGDGIYIGSGALKYNEDVYIANHYASNNRRQGMSVISAKRLVVDSPVWENTNGADPQAGCDIEPNRNDEFLEFIRINNPITRNNAGVGIVIHLAALAGATAKVIDIQITNHQDDGSLSGFAVNFLDATNYSVRGRITTVDPVWRNSKLSAMSSRAYDANGPRVDVIRPLVVNPNTSGSAAVKYGSVFTIFRESKDGGSYVIGGINIVEPSIHIGATTPPRLFHVTDDTAFGVPSKISILDVRELIGSTGLNVNCRFNGQLSDRYGVWGARYSISSTLNGQFRPATALHDRTSLSFLTLDNESYGAPSLRIRNINTGPVGVVPPAGGAFLGVTPGAYYICAASAGHEIELTPMGGGVWRVDRLSGTWTLVGHLEASTTYDPPPLADGEGTTTTVTVPGAALGDYAEASFSRDLQGVTVTAWVSSADTVSVRFQNESGGTVDLASGTLRVRVRK